MNVRTIACPAAGFSATLSLLNLNISMPIGIGFAKTLTSSDVFNVYGTLDSAAADATNATSIGQLAGTAGANLDPQFIKKMLMWPHVILERVSGTGAGNFEVAGNLDAAPAVVSAALPASGSYTTLMDLTGFDSTVRIGTSRQQTTSDTFDVYVTNDSTINPAVTATAGAFMAGSIAGGGERSGLLSSLVVQGYAYCFLKRTAGSTAGNALAASSSVPATSGTAWLVGGNTLPAGTHILGTLDAGAVLSERAEGIEILLSDGVVIAVGNLEASVPGSSLQLAAGSGGGTWDVDSTGDLSFTVASGVIHLTSGGGITLNSGSLISLQPTGAIELLPRAGAGNTAILSFFELAVNGANFVGFKAADALAGDTIYTLPNAGATVAGQYLASDAASASAQNLSWAGGTVNVQANNTNAQSIADGAAAAIVTTWTAVTDTAGAFTPATGVFAAPVGGFYLITAELEYSAIASIVAGEFTCQIFKNGTLVASGVEVCQVAAANVKRNPKVSFIVQLGPTDTIDIRASQNSGSGANTLTNVGTRNFLSISRVG